MKKEQGFILPIIIVVAVVALLGTAGYFAYKQYSAPKEQLEQIACTMDAKVCPDGSSVSRTGPNCEFAECPGGTSSIVYSDDKKYSAFMETIEEPNLIISKIHVKNQQTSEDKIIKTKSCCINGAGCGLCPLPCQIKSFSPNNKYILQDCGTSPARTINVINIDTKKEISISSASNYFWLNNEEIAFSELRESDEPSGYTSYSCRINIISGVKNCDSKTAGPVPSETEGWINCNNNKYGFSIKLPQSLFEGCYINEYNLTDAPGFEYRIEFSSKNAGPERFGIAVATKQVDVDSNHKFLGQQDSKFFYIDAWGCCAEGNSPDIKDLILNIINPTFKFTEE